MCDCREGLKIPGPWQISKGSQKEQPRQRLSQEKKNEKKICKLEA